MSMMPVRVHTRERKLLNTEFVVEYYAHSQSCEKRPKVPRTMNVNLWNYFFELLLDWKKIHINNVKKFEHTQFTLKQISQKILPFTKQLPEIRWS